MPKFESPSLEKCMQRERIRLKGLIDRKAKKRNAAIEKIFDRINALYPLIPQSRRDISFLQNTDDIQHINSRIPILTSNKDVQVWIEVYPAKYVLYEYWPKQKGDPNFSTEETPGRLMEALAVLLLAYGSQRQHLPFPCVHIIAENVWKVLYGRNKLFGDEDKIFCRLIRKAFPKVPSKVLRVTKTK